MFYVPVDVGVESVAGAGELFHGFDVVLSGSGVAVCVELAGSFEFYGYGGVVDGKGFDA